MRSGPTKDGFIGKGDLGGGLEDSAEYRAMGRKGGHTKTPVSILSVIWIWHSTHTIHKLVNCYYYRKGGEFSGAC